LVVAAGHFGPGFEYGQRGRIHPHGGSSGV
jgi:hypothetical protein